MVQLELDYVDGRSALEMARDASLRKGDLRRASDAVGRLVAGMIAAGLFNRDMILANLVIDARNMVILKKEIGDHPAVLWPFVEAELARRGR